MRKWMIFGAAGILAAVAMAQVQPLAAVGGQGVAVNAQERRAEFRFEARKVQGENGPVVRGNFNFTLVPPPNSNGGEVRLRVAINSRNIDRLGANNNVGEFSGQAVMVVPGQNGRPNEIRGRVAVRIVDNRNPRDPNFDPSQPKDTIQVHFTGPTTAQAFDWQGQVDRGDLFVRIPQTNP